MARYDEAVEVDARDDAKGAMNDRNVHIAGGA